MLSFFSWATARQIPFGDLDLGLLVFYFFLLFGWLVLFGISFSHSSNGS